MKTITLLLCTLLCIKGSFAQSLLLEDALIVKHNNDSSVGQIIMEDEKSILQRLIFIDLNKDTATFQANEIRQLILTKYPIYFEPVTLPAKGKNKDKIFLCKILCRGNATLYMIEDSPEQFDLESGNAPFFIVKSPKGLFPLIAKDNDNSVEKYRGILTYALSDCKSFQSYHMDTRYNPTYLSALITSYNKCMDTAYVPEEMKVSHLPIHLSHQVLTSFALCPTPWYYANNKLHYQNNIAYGFGYIIDILSPSVSRKSSLTTGVQYLYFPKQEIPAETVESYPSIYATQSLSSFRFPFMGSYMFSYQKISPFVQAGGSLEFLSNDLTKWTPFLSLGAGLKVNRIYCSGSFELPLNFLEVLRERKIIQLKLAYTFCQTKNET